MDEIIRVENLSGGYPHAPVFEGLSLSFHGPGLCTVIGPNGSGKSTLLKFLYRELAPQSGQVLLEGKDIASYSRRAIAKRIALVPQWGRIEEDFTVRDAVAMAGSLHVEESLDTCDLSDKADASVLSLSGGEFQRTLIARALAQDTPVLLLDEPVNNLDISYQVSTLRLVKDLAHHGGKLVILVLHDLTMAQVYSDDVVLLNHGKLVAQGAPQEVITKERIESVYGTPMQWDETNHLLVPVW
ncbi:MAG: ABC transporter ATP-binding protein [Sphaerochaeta sp.]|jgi:iron complex transport system ATP-binding protein|nr:ABC transporter ATP-binding protein [Sphaerochaeta sp.]MCI2128665.1 ABC transporter ATP-binding protein [Sphaerochaeta sp.]